MFQNGLVQPPPPSPTQRLLGVWENPPGSNGLQEAIQRVRLSLYVNGLSISGDIKRVGVGLGVGFGGLGGALEGSEVGWFRSWVILKLTVDLATWGFLMRHSETMTKRTKQQHESFFRGHGDCRCLEQINGRIYASKS